MKLRTGHGRDFFFEITSQILPYIDARTTQEAAFSILALMVYGQKLQSVMMGAVTPVGVANSARSRAFGGPGAAEGRINRVIDRLKFRDKFFNSRKLMEQPYQDRSGQMTASIRVLGKYVQGTSTIQFSGSIGDFTSVAPIRARFLPKGSVNYKRNYYDALDKWMRDKRKMSLVQYVERAMLKAVLPDTEYSTTLEEVRAKYSAQVLTTPATKAEAHRAATFLSRVKARSNLQTLDPRRLVPYPR